MYRRRCSRFNLGQELTLAINFSGEFTTPRSPEEVFDFLSDPNQFAPLLPDFQSMSMQDATHFTVKVKVGVGNIRGSAEIKMELAEAVKPLRAQYKGQGNAVGSQVTVSAGFDLSPQPDSTKVVWQGETSVFGKLASMAGGMLEPLGRKNIQKLIDGLQKALAEPVAKTEAPGISLPEADALEYGAAAMANSGVASNAACPSQVPVEAQDFNPAASTVSTTEASVPDSIPAEGAHGDDNAQPNN